MSSKVCAPRKTSAHPQVYTVKELRELAKTKKIKGYTKMSKKELCQALKINWVGADQKAKPKIKVVYKKESKAESSTPKKTDSSSYKNKRCDINPSKKNPNAYKKVELVNLAIEELGLSKSEAGKMTKIELCKSLNRKKDFIPPSKSDKNCIDRSNLELRKHQKKVVKHLEKYRGLIASFQTGAGKTLTAVTASQCYLDANPNGKIYVVSPLSLIENFKKEMVKYGVSASDPRYHFYTFSSFQTTFKNKPCAEKAMLIIDEAHNLRNLKSERTGVAIRCAQKVDKVLLLTATPMYNQITDIIPLIAMVRGERPLSVKGFDNLVERTYDFRSYVGCAIAFFDINQDENYPSFKEVVKTIKMTPEYYKEYHKVEKKDNLAKLAFNHPFMFFNGVRQATNALPNNPKVAYAVKIAEENNKKGKKTWIYSSFKGSGTKQITDRLDIKKIPYVLITGDVSAKDRKEAMRKYNLPSSNKNSINVMITSKAGGEGLDPKGVRDEIILESTWNRQEQIQVRGRAVRFGSHSHLPPSERNVTITRLILAKPDKLAAGDKRKKSADEELRDLANEKQVDIERVEADLRAVDILKVGNKDCERAMNFKPPPTPQKKGKREMHVQRPSPNSPPKKLPVRKLDEKVGNYTFYIIEQKVIIKASKRNLEKLVKLARENKIPISSKKEKSIEIKRIYRTKLKKLIRKI